MPQAINESTQHNVVMACIDDRPKAVVLLSIARKRAQERNCAWRAVFIETPSYYKKSQKQPEEGGRERILKLLTLAEQMGGETVHIEAETSEKGMADLLQKEVGNTVLMLIGSGEMGGFRFLPLPWMRVVNVAMQYAQVEIVPFSSFDYHCSFAERFHLPLVKPQHILYALFAVAVATIGASFLEWALPPALFRINSQNVALLFMIACAFVAGRFGIIPGLLASVASFLTVNYYYTVPYHILKISTVTDVINMVLFLSAAVLISIFTSQTRYYGQKSAQRELSTQVLFTLYRIASESYTRSQAMEKLQRKLEDILEAGVAFFLPTVINPERVEPAFPPETLLNEADRKALNSCWTEMKTTGAASPLNPGTEWRFEPMISPIGEIGVLGIKPRGNTRLDAWFGRLLTSIADQTATVLQHIQLERTMEDTRLHEEREKLRSMLLSSVSHDFKTPLAGIIGALSVHRSLGDKLSPQKRSELIEAAIEEAQRLDSFITNILDMTRLESGAIQFRKEWHNLKSSLDSVMKRMKHRLRNHQLVVHPYPDKVGSNHGYYDD